MAEIQNEYQAVKKRVLEKTKISSVTINFKDGTNYTYTASEFWDQVKEFLMQGLMMADHKEYLEKWFMGT